MSSQTPVQNSLNFGYACINNSIRKDGIFTGRTCRIKNFSLARVSELIEKNTADLFNILKWNEENRIRLFRVSSDLFPFYDHPDLRYSIDDLPHREEIYHNFRLCKELALKSGQRLTMHPGPYTNLSSPNDDVRKKARLTLAMHRDIMQLLESRDPVINIHVGGNFSKERAQTFCKEVEILPLSIRNMLTVENDDKPNGYSVNRLWENIWYWTGVPILIDLHHHKFCNDGRTMKEDYYTAMSTWNGRKPKIHYSESDPNKRAQAHSYLVEGPIPDFVEGDVMIESKGKELSCLAIMG